MENSKWKNKKQYKIGICTECKVRKVILLKRSFINVLIVKNGFVKNISNLD